MTPGSPSLRALGLISPLPAPATPSPSDVSGSLAGSGTVNINPSDLGVTTANYLGKSQFGADPYLKAALDDFRLYAYAMSPAEITTLTQPPAGAPRQLAVLPGNTLATLAWAPNQPPFTPLNAPPPAAAPTPSLPTA